MKYSELEKINIENASAVLKDNILQSGMYPEPVTDTLLTQ